MRYNSKICQNKNRKPQQKSDDVALLAGISISVLFPIVGDLCFYKICFPINFLCCLKGCFFLPKKYCCQAPLCHLCCNVHFAEYCINRCWKWYHLLSVDLYTSFSYSITSNFKIPISTICIQKKLSILHRIQF